MYKLLCCLLAEILHTLTHRSSHTHAETYTPCQHASMLERGAERPNCGRVLELSIMCGELHQKMPESGGSCCNRWCDGNNMLGVTTPFMHVEKPRHMHLCGKY